MHKLFKTLAAAALAAALSATGFAQSAGPSGGAITPTTAATARANRPHVNLQALQNSILNQLNLTQAQRAQIIALNKQTLADVQQIRTAVKAARGNPTARQEGRAKLKELLQAHDRALGQILTPDQRKQYVTLWKAAIAKIKAQAAANQTAPPAPKP